MSFRDPNWLGRTASLITSGRCGTDMRPSCRQGEHGNSYEQSCRGMVIAGLVALVWLSGCARLELIGEPEGAESQVTLDSLKAAVREGQRATTDLRTELADRRKELADAQVARAQLQGMLRETESRLTDARHIIELQREELAAARVDRERVEESGRQLHSRLRRLETRLAQARRQGEMIPSAYIPRHSGELAQSVHVTFTPESAVVGRPASDGNRTILCRSDSRYGGCSGGSRCPAHHHCSRRRYAMASGTKTWGGSGRVAANQRPSGHSYRGGMDAALARPRQRGGNPRIRPPIDGAITRTRKSR